MHHEVFGSMKNGKRCHPVVGESRRRAPSGRSPKRSCHPVSSTTIPTFPCSSCQADRPPPLSPGRGGLHFPLRLNTFPLSPLLSSHLIQSSFSVSPPAPQTSCSQPGHSRPQPPTESLLPACLQESHCDLTRSAHLPRLPDSCCAAAGSCTLIPEETNSRSRNKSAPVAALPPQTTLKKKAQQPNQLINQAVPLFSVFEMDCQDS